MTEKQFICDQPCPLCGSEVQVFGSDCYPESGIAAECMNLDCDYELKITCSVRTNFLRNTVKEAHNIMCKLIKQGKQF